MWRLARKHKMISAIAGILFLLLVAWVWNKWAGVRGHFQARIDLRGGKYELLGYGLPTAWRPEYVRCLRERYDVQFRAVAGCTVTPGLVDYVHGYDAEVLIALRAKYGRNISEECKKEAEESWKAVPPAR